MTMRKIETLATSKKYCAGCEWVCEYRGVGGVTMELYVNSVDVVLLLNVYPSIENIEIGVNFWSIFSMIN